MMNRPDGLFQAPEKARELQRETMIMTNDCSRTYSRSFYIGRDEDRETEAANQATLMSRTEVNEQPSIEVIQQHS